MRGFTDDFWATFVEPIPNDPASRIMTIYASGLVNINEASPQVLLGRVCSYAPDVSLCTDPLEGLKFTQILATIRQLIPIPLFSRPTDLLNFVEGKGTEKELYGMLTGFLGPESELIFRTRRHPRRATHTLSLALSQPRLKSSPSKPPGWWAVLRFESSLSSTFTRGGYHHHPTPDGCQGWASSTTIG